MLDKVVPDELRHHVLVIDTLHFLSNTNGILKNEVSAEELSSVDFTLPGQNPQDSLVNRHHRFVRLACEKAEGPNQLNLLEVQCNGDHGLLDECCQLRTHLGESDTLLESLDDQIDLVYVVLIREFLVEQDPEKSATDIRIVLPE